MKSPELKFWEAMDDLTARHDDANMDLRKLLTKRGWAWTCNTPGSVWLWQKTLKDGRTLLVNENTAVELEQELEMQGERRAERIAAPGNEMWQDWWAELKQKGEEMGCPIADDSEGRWKEYFWDCLSPAEAIGTAMAQG